MPDGFYALTFTDEQKAAMRLALEQRRYNLEAVLILSGGRTAQAVDRKLVVIAEILGKLDRAKPEGIECDRCGGTVSPQTGTPHFCSQICWTQHIGEVNRARLSD